MDTVNQSVLIQSLEKCLRQALKLTQISKYVNVFEAFSSEEKRKKALETNIQAKKYFQETIIKKYGSKLRDC